MGMPSNQAVFHGFPTVRCGGGGAVSPAPERRWKSRLFDNNDDAGKMALACSPRLSRNRNKESQSISPNGNATQGRRLKSKDQLCKHIRLKGTTDTSM